ADVTDTDPGALIAQLLPSLENEDDVQTMRTSRLAAALARAGAAPRAAMDPEALSGLLTALASCDNANYTPSGTPTFLRITQEEIKRRL
ncbi:MAG: hypothetical protein LBU95_01490, partial [Rikenellaceae bacterium]|nr:hypothetical protein [Rikenellaceae bacterium]